MIFADSPLSDKAIGRYISAKVAMKRRTLKERPAVLKELVADAVHTSGIAADENVSRLTVDPEVTTAIKVQIYDGFFADLAILDQKAGALSSVIAIITGFIVFLAGGDNGPMPKLVGFALLSATVSLLLTISVLTVRWSSSDQLADRTLDKSLVSICRVRSWRTIRFRLALYLAFLALVLISVYFSQVRSIL